MKFKVIGLKSTGVLDDGWLEFSAHPARTRDPFEHGVVPRNIIITVIQ